MDSYTILKGMAKGMEFQYNRGMKQTLAQSPGYFTPDELGPESTQFYRDNGFLVVTGTVDRQELDQLKAETVQFCRGKRGGIQIRGETPAYLENEASMTDEEVQRHLLCIHYPHKASEIMYRYLAHPNIVRCLTSVIGPNVKCMQSMLFIKSAGKPGQAWHQDEHFIPTRDRSLTGAWIAIDDATVENGCLWVLPGSHQRGIIWPQFAHTDKRFDCAHESFNFPYTDEDAIPVEVPAGSVVVFNGYLLHRSLPNKAKDGFRRVLVNHYMSAESYLPWRLDGDKPVGQLDFRDVVMVAGEDPYPWKEIIDVNRPHVRPDGMGGCGDGRKLI